MPSTPDIARAGRQENLRARLRCFYAGDARAAERPGCEGVAVVAYGSIVLCASCKQLKSAGRNPPRKLAGAELTELLTSAEQLDRAEARLAGDVGRACASGASWEQIGDAIGISRQAAQQRFGQTARDEKGGCFSPTDDTAVSAT